MTRKYSAQWWEKVAARPQQTATEQDELETAGEVERQRNRSSSGENQRITRKAKQEAS